MPGKMPSQALLPPVLIVIMVASLLLPIGAFFGFFMQKKSRFKKLEKEYKLKADELKKRIDKFQLKGLLAAKDKHISRALNELFTYYCETSTEAYEILKEYKENLTNKKEYHFRITKYNPREIRIFNHTSDAIEYRFEGWTTVKGLWDILSNITSIGNPCLRCFTDGCKDFGAPILDLTVGNCKECNKVLRRNFIPKFAFIEKFELIAKSLKSAKIGAKHQFKITLIVPIYQEE